MNFTAKKALARLVWLPWIGVLLLVAALTIVTRKVNAGMADRQDCEMNLREIFMALDQFERENEKLPSLEMYPSNPRTDRNSLLVALAGYGLSPESCHCPRAPSSIGREQTLTYLWNVELNGMSLRDVPRDTWMVIEINALSSTIQAPHFGKYNTLLVDGSVASTRSIPELLNVSP